MTMIKRFYKIEEFTDDTIDTIDICIIGCNSEERTKNLPSIWSNKFKGNSFIINYKLKEEQYSLKQISFSNLETYPEDYFDITANLANEIGKIGLNDKVILIDITGLKQPVFFYLLKIIHQNFHPRKILIAYTEPLKYKRKGNNKEEFNLTEDFLGIKALPGFIRPIDNSKEKVLVALIGFEGNRFSYVFQELTPDLRKTHAITGFPPFRPGWQYFSYSCNKNILEASKAFHNLHRATAFEPFSAYDILNSIKEQYPNGQLSIVPLGTKPHALGAVLFAIQNNDVRLIYDFPLITNNFRTEGVGQAYIYDITNILLGM